MRPIDADALNIDREHFDTYADYSHAFDMIDNAPTIDAEPVRHGRWLPKHHYIAGYEFVSGHICSECGNDALNAEGDDFLTDFCPNCGARMDAERKEE